MSPHDNASTPNSKYASIGSMPTNEEVCFESKGSCDDILDIPSAPLNTTSYIIKSRMPCDPNHQPNYAASSCSLFNQIGQDDDGLFKFISAHGGLDGVDYDDENPNSVHSSWMSCQGDPNATKSKTESFDESIGEPEKEDLSSRAMAMPPTIRGCEGKNVEDLDLVDYGIEKLRFLLRGSIKPTKQESSGRDIGSIGCVDQHAKEHHWKHLSKSLQLKIKCQDGRIAELEEESTSLRLRVTTIERELIALRKIACYLELNGQLGLFESEGSSCNSISVHG